MAPLWQKKGAHHYGRALFYREVGILAKRLVRLLGIGMFFAGGTLLLSLIYAVARVRAMIIRSISLRNKKG